MVENLISRAEKVRIVSVEGGMTEWKIDCLYTAHVEGHEVGVPC